MGKKLTISAIILIVAGALVGGLLGRLPLRASAEQTSSSQQVVGDVKQALELIQANYGGKVDGERVVDSSMQAMLWTLDPHSSFFSREEFEKLNEDQASEFYGIGVSILQHRDGVYVQSVVQGTPAEKAGMHYGDRIVSVDGKDAKEWSSSEVSRNVRGPHDTSVKIQVERAGSAAPVDLEITRGGVPLPSVRNTFMLNDSTGYIGLTGGFQQTTADELSTSVAELKKKGMKGLVLDLRGNPGGILEEAIQVVSKFVPSGKTVVSVKGAGGQEARDLTHGGGNETFPLVVLVNSGSASASEIVSGAIQDYDRGLIVGTDSFGKGLVQHVFRLPYGTGLTLTTARYYTPYGRSLQRDYSSGSIYDYYTHGEDEPNGSPAVPEPKPAGSPVTTPDGRTLYGGRGIEPDVRVQAEAITPLKGRINEAAFFFVRQYAAGKVAGFESSHIDKQNFKDTIQTGDFPVTDKLYEAFKTFAANDKQNGLTAANIDSQPDYAKRRLREELATATDSSEAGLQVLLESDLQVQKAIDVMPKANDLLAIFSKNMGLGV